MLEPDMPSMVAPPLLPAAAITPPPRVSTRFARKWLWAIAAVAVLFRLADASQPGFHHPDEIWQYVEPAYGWVTGHWIVPWEFHVGLRGWLIPALFAPIIALGQFVAPGTPFDQALLRCVLAVLALIVPATFWRIGRQVSTIHGLGAALMAAIWPEIFYFAGRPSGENLACILLFAAIWLLWRPMPGGHSRRDALLVGVCLALATIIRFQYLPAIGLLALRGIWPDPRRLIGPMVLGGVAGIAIGGLADLAAGQTPFLWIW
ncbi:MAG TPA: mannosyltransferase, partial [Novosphingobium sp.]|nr:mannosyltransferase [Novosphingobium sp.]